MPASLQVTSWCLEKNTIRFKFKHFSSSKQVMSGTDQLLTVAEHFKPLFEKTVKALCKDVTEELEKTMKDASQDTTKEVSKHSMSWLRVEPWALPNIIYIYIHIYIHMICYIFQLWNCNFGFLSVTFLPFVMDNVWWVSCGRMLWRTCHTTWSLDHWKILFVSLRRWHQLSLFSLL